MGCQKGIALARRFDGDRRVKSPNGAQVRKGKVPDSHWLTEAALTGLSFGSRAQAGEPDVGHGCSSRGAGARPGSQGSVTGVSLE